MNIDATPTVSVLVPVFNRERHIRRCIGSVINQDFRDLEIVIVDDGSTDGTGLAVSEIGDGRIRYYRNDRNRGISYTRNRLTALARGRYLAVLDSDDLSEPGRIGRQVNFLENNPQVAVVSGRVRLIDEEGRDLDQIWGARMGPGEIAASLPFGNVIYNSAVMARREFLCAFPCNPELRTAEDYDVWLRGCRANKYEILDDILTAYRIHGGNISKEREGEINANAIELRRAFLGELAGRYIPDSILNGLLADLNGPFRDLFSAYRLLARLSESSDLFRSEVASRVLRGVWQRCIFRVERFCPLYILLLWGDLSKELSWQMKAKYALKSMLFRPNPFRANKVVPVGWTADRVN